MGLQVGLLSNNEWTFDIIIFLKKKHECDFDENWRAVDLFAVFFGLIFMVFRDEKNAFGDSDENWRVEDLLAVLPDIFYSLFPYFFSDLKLLCYCRVEDLSAVFPEIPPLPPLTLLE